jgi:CubicO group peptidase (beta-lactamase class C family)
MPNIDAVEDSIEPLLRAARTPGAAVAVVAEGQTIFAKGYGYRDLDAKLPTTAATVYPIASTTKAFNATLLGILVDEGRLAWDVPVRKYLPRFSLQDPCVSAQVTLRDLVVMRTGLPRHDWLWAEHALSRAELADRLRYLELSAGFRERWQYNNLTVTTAGHIAEVVAGESWEDLLRQKILTPLQMNSTGFTLPPQGDFTLSYHENSDRQIALGRRFAAEVTAPAGGAVHSTVLDMARWISFNLSGGKAVDRQLIEPKTLAEIHSPQMAIGAELSGLTYNTSYAMGWFVDTYNGRSRISHGGYLHDVSSEVHLYPNEGIGIVSFTNFGGSALARYINQHVLDLMMGLKPTQTLEARLALYENRIEATRKRNESARRVENTAPSHALGDYEGIYVHPGYGRLEIQHAERSLILRRDNLLLPLRHWHYDSWVAEECDLFNIDTSHAFDRVSRILFETNVDGDIAALSIRLEPAVARIRFEKQQDPSK